jgi:hypothetical protein
MAGVVLVAISQGMPEGAQVVTAGIRDLGFAGMGAALLRTHRVSGYGIAGAWRHPASASQ